MYIVYKFWNSKLLKLSEAEKWDDAVVHCDAYYKKDPKGYYLISYKDEIHCYNDLFY